LLLAVCNLAQKLLGSAFAAQVEYFFEVVSQLVETCCLSVCAANPGDTPDVELCLRVPFDKRCERAHQLRSSMPAAALRPGEAARFGHLVAPQASVGDPALVRLTALS